MINFEQYLFATAINILIALLLALISNIRVEHGFGRTLTNVAGITSAILFLLQFFSACFLLVFVFSN